MNLLLNTLVSIKLALSPVGESIGQSVQESNVVERIQLKATQDVVQEAPVQFFKIGTGGSGGTYFVIGGVLANAISNPPGSRPCDAGGSCGVKGLIAVAQSTDGSLDNLQKLESGAIQSALVQEDIAKSAVKSNKDSALRLIAPLYPDSLHIVVRAESNIKTLDDLAGKKVSLGQEESGTASTAANLFKERNIRIRAAFSSPEQAAANLFDKSTAAFVILGGYPIPIIRTLAELTPIRLIPIESDTETASGIIPADTYKGVPDTTTMQIMASWLTTKNQSEDLIYEMTKAFWHDSSIRLLQRSHSQGRKISMERALERIALDRKLELHPGAAKFYREISLQRLYQP